MTSCKNEEEHKEDTKNVLAQVGGVSITEKVFRSWWEKDSQASDTPASREASLQNLIERTQLVERARQADLESDPAVKSAYESLLIARLREIELEPALAGVEITEQELREAYETQKGSRFKQGARHRLAVIWLDPRGQEPLELRYEIKLQRLRDSLIAGEITLPENGSFGNLAINHTEHSGSRYKGGEVGWIYQRPYADPWRGALSMIAASLKEPGELSEVIIRDEGVFLVRLMAVETAKDKPFELVREQIKRELLGQKRAAARAHFKKATAESSQVVINNESLHALSNLLTDSKEPTPPRLPDFSNSP